MGSNQRTGKWEKEERNVGGDGEGDPMEGDWLLEGNEENQVDEGEWERWLHVWPAVKERRKAPY